MDLRAMQSIYTFPTLVIFASGKGIATAKALIEATGDTAGLDLDFRQTVRLYYRVSPVEIAIFEKSTACLSQRGNASW